MVLLFCSVLFVAPVAHAQYSLSAGGPYTVVEGGSVTVTATGYVLSHVLDSVYWDFGLGGATVGGGSATFSAGTLDGPSSQTITVINKLWNSVTWDFMYRSAQTTVTIINVAP